MTGRTRIYYRESPRSVVVEQDGKQLAVYKDVEALVETHIKGMLAVDSQDSKRTRELLNKYRSTDSLTKK